ncbi:hypothetical protein O6072_25490 [Mycolicibacterium neoaurum]|nr:hypothetical protein [Mycolicibacterium neoaurum]WBP94309.1 hypothetical protein O7W24_24860 [Mycolicibacterium neoaurum]WBS08115.1 hypothetical protein O6072_25490 [Mycolicibacterium neoaurum]
MSEPARIALRLLGLILLVAGVVCAVLRIVTRPPGRGPLVLDLRNLRRGR